MQLLLQTRQHVISLQPTKVEGHVFCLTRKLRSDMESAWAENCLFYFPVRLLINRMIFDLLPNLRDSCFLNQKVRIRIFTVLVCYGCRNKITGWMGAFTTKFYFSQCWRVEHPVWAGLVLTKTSLLGSQRATLSLCPHVVCVVSILTSSYKDTIVLDYSSPVWLHFSLITSLKALSPKTVTFEVLRVRVSTSEFWKGHHSAH